jgi:hypothetical protein
MDLSATTNGLHIDRSHPGELTHRIGETHCTAPTSSRDGEA